MIVAPVLRGLANACSFRSHAIVRVAVGICLAAAGILTAMPAPLKAQPYAGSAWSFPEPNDLLSQAIHRIVTQDKPGGLPIAQYDARAFGREETVAAARAFASRVVVLTPTIFADVSDWPEARATDSLPCHVIVAPATIQDTASSRCRVTNALWLAISRIERGPLPHELHVWYVTRFRTDVQGSMQSATYSFCERWLRIGGVWKYDGFVRMTKGVVAPAPLR